MRELIKTLSQPVQLLKDYKFKASVQTVDLKWDIVVAKKEMVL